MTQEVAPEIIFLDKQPSLSLRLEMKMTRMRLGVGVKPLLQISGSFGRRASLKVVKQLVVFCTESARSILSVCHVLDLLTHSSGGPGF